jgi:uracil phosphoribosyltransferase
MRDATAGIPPRSERGGRAHDLRGDADVCHGNGFGAHPAGEDQPGERLKREVVLVPVLRAGLGMLDSILQLIPKARVGFIGLKRQEDTLAAQFYHKSLPKDLREREVILIDPMLATGGSTVAAMRLLEELGAHDVRLVNLVASPEGVRHVQSIVPRLRIFTAAIDAGLNKRGFILPGLGDAGDRLFGV